MGSTAPELASQSPLPACGSASRSKKGPRAGGAALSIPSTPPGCGPGGEQGGGGRGEAEEEEPGGPHRGPPPQPLPARHPPGPTPPAVSRNHEHTSEQADADNGEDIIHHLAGGELVSTRPRPSQTPQSWAEAEACTQRGSQPWPLPWGPPGLCSQVPLLATKLPQREGGRAGQESPRDKPGARGGPSSPRKQAAGPSSRTGTAPATLAKESTSRSGIWGRAVGTGQAHPEGGIPGRQTSSPMPGRGRAASGLAWPLHAQGTVAHTPG